MYALLYIPSSLCCQADFHIFFFIHFHIPIVRFVSKTSSSLYPIYVVSPLRYLSLFNLNTGIDIAGARVFIKVIEGAVTSNKEAKRNELEGGLPPAPRRCKIPQVLLRLHSQLYSRHRNTLFIPGSVKPRKNAFV